MIKIINDHTLHPNSIHFLIYLNGSSYIFAYPSPSIIKSRIPPVPKSPAFISNFLLYIS